MGGTAVRASAYTTTSTIGHVTINLPKPDRVASTGFLCLLRNRAVI